MLLHPQYLENYLIKLIDVTLMANFYKHKKRNTVGHYDNRRPGKLQKYEEEVIALSEQSITIIVLNSILYRFSQYLLCIL